MLLTAVCIVLLIVLILEWFLNRRSRARAFWKIPGRRGTLIFGNCLDVVETPDVLFKKLRKWANSYKDLYRQWIFPYGVVHIYNPNDIEVIISNSKYNTKSLLYDFLRPWLRDGLLLSKGNKWQVRRKILTPSFHFNILQHFTTIVEENSSRLIRNLAKGEIEQTLDAVPLMSDVTLNSICETSMGTKLDEDTSGAGKIYKNSIHEIGKLIIYRIARSWLVFDTIFHLTKEGRRQKQVLKIIHEFPKKIIEERRSYIESHGFEIPTSDLNEDVVLGPLKRKMAMLDLLLFAEKDGLINEDGIQEEVDTFMFEGHDTTAMGLTYALLELANNPAIQDKVARELNDIFSESTRTASIHDLGQMKYLESCIKETLRLYPPVPFISRYLTDGLILSGHSIPPGMTLCHIHIFDLHRREDLYPEPLSFNPDRFAPENCISRHPYAYIPFSGGSRNCIGQRFAMMEMKSVLSAILRQFILLPVTNRSELEFTTDLVLRTTHPIYVKFVRRNNVNLQ
uniref:Cytochrome P450 CYP4M42 n=1 Tax=Zygaena filipendulae TaxID=287375 RepID=A0A286MXM1_9NEOP|nr:cytochrome P450 CYP4M42 [Zygaena filipendulae]